MSARAQWESVRGGLYNLGVRCGGDLGYVAIDCDEPRATENVKAWLAGRGLADRLLKVRTVRAGGGVHYWLRTSGAWTSTSSGDLAVDIGDGELRWGPGAYVAAPCSVVGGSAYAIEAGSPEMMRGLPVLPWLDLVPLLKVRRDASMLVHEFVNSGEVGAAVVPVALLRRDLRPMAREILRLTSLSVPGVQVAGYSCRSEAEGAVVRFLIVSGWTFEEVLALFEEMRPGHYREHERRLWWIRHEYQSGLALVVAEPVRSAIAEQYAASWDWLWPGGGGGTDAAVYRAMLSVGWQFETWRPYASYRDLVLLADVSIAQVYEAAGRLVNAGLVCKCGRHRDLRDGSQRWNLMHELPPEVSQREKSVARDATNGSKSGTKPNIYLQVGGKRQVPSCATALFVAGILGRTSALVLPCLSATGATVVALSRQCGKSRRVVLRDLRVLARYSLAVNVDGRWRRGGASLVEVAAAVGVGGGSGAAVAAPAASVDAGGSASGSGVRGLQVARDREAWQKRLEVRDGRARWLELQNGPAADVWESESYEVSVWRMLGRSA